MTRWSRLPIGIGLGLFLLGVGIKIYKADVDGVVMISIGCIFLGVGLCMYIIEKFRDLDELIDQVERLEKRNKQHAHRLRIKDTPEDSG
jgi:Na+/phosphate symporter